MEYKKLGQFKIDRSLAQGGMGEISKSVDEQGRVIVLKTILRPYLEDPTFRNLFMREAEITFQLDHPNIVRAYHFKTIGNQLVLALEYLEGVNLREILARTVQIKGQIPLAVAATIIQRICRGLQYAHDKRDENNKALGIIHRDLNPTNIFVTYSGEMKILDFGISKATQKSVHQLSPSGELRGKICYLSPEQIQGDAIDHRSDIFSLGIVLWEMLAGRPLFKHQSDSDVLEHIVSGKISKIDNYREDIPEAFTKVVYKALAVNPKERYQSCAEFEKAIEQAVWRSTVPGTAEDEVSIYARALFQGHQTMDPNFRAGYAWLLAQMGKEEKAVMMLKSLAETHSSLPYVQLNYARLMLFLGQKPEGYRALRRLARVDSLEQMAQELLEWCGVRRKPVLSFLPRSNPMNRLIGLVRHKILGPTEYQHEFLAA